MARVHTLCKPYIQYINKSDTIYQQLYTTHLVPSCSFAPHCMQLQAHPCTTGQVAHTDAQFHHLIPAPHRGTALDVRTHWTGGLWGAEQHMATVQSHVCFNLMRKYCCEVGGGEGGLTYQGIHGYCQPTSIHHSYPQILCDPPCVPGVHWKGING